MKISNDQKIGILWVILDNAYRYHQFARILNSKQGKIFNE
jgi:hypothetical protein